MKLTFLASLIMASSASFAAEHAVLNVEGEIQINGKTIIDHNGKVTTAGYGAINLDEYQRPNGTYTYTTTYVNHEGYTGTCNNTETISETGYYYVRNCSGKIGSYSMENPNYTPDFYPSHEEYLACEAVNCTVENLWDNELGEYIENPNYDPDFYPTNEEQDACNIVQCTNEFITISSPDAIQTSTYDSTYTDTAVGVDSTWKHTSTIKDNNTGYTKTEESEDSESLAITPLSEYSPWYVIGSTKSKTEKVTSLDTSESYFNHYTIQYTDEIKNVIIKGKEYDSCLVSDLNYNSDPLSLLCKGVGYLSVNADDISLGNRQEKSIKSSEPAIKLKKSPTGINYFRARSLTEQKINIFKSKQQKNNKNTSECKMHS